MLALALGSAPVRAGEAAHESPIRVMLVHGVWVSGPWQQAFQNGISEGLAEFAPRDYEISHQLLGLYDRSTPDSHARVARYLEATVAEQQMEWLVCTLPTACRFLLDLELPGVHRILVSAEPETRRRAAEQDDTVVVTSGAPQAIAGTFEHIQRLRPGTRVTLLTGTSSNDRVYLDMALSMNEKRSEPLPVEVVRATGPDALTNAVAALDPARETGFLLTSEAWGDPPTRFAPGSLEAFGAAAAAPVFVFWDAAVGLGPVGGMVASAPAYARPVAELISAGAAGQQLPDRVEGAAEPLYDAGEVERWGLELDRLATPPRLINVQPPLWETNPAAVYTAVAVAVLLLSVIILLATVLYASRRAHRERARRAAEEAAAHARQVQRQKMEALGNLSAGIAHDFNNVLGVIMGLTDLLRQPETNRVESERLLAQLDQAADRARRLVGQILTFSRNSRGSAESVDLAAIVAQTVAHQQSVLPEGVQLSLDTEGPRAGVTGDPQRLEQAIGNLVTNAVEAVSGRGGRVAVHTRLFDVDEARPCTVNSLTPGSWVELTVRDDGPGIPEEAADRMFEPFYTSKALGSGIGLAIVHGVVTEHHGAIDVRTGPQEGTEFRVYLPAQAMTSDDLLEDVAPPETAQDAGPSESLQVLLVDDQQDVLEVVATMCQSFGHQVTRSDSARGALDLLDEGADFDLMVTDYSMPEINGLELIRACRERRPGIRCVLTTGYAGEETEKEAMAAGAAAVVTKPVRFRVLRETLSRLAVSVGEGETGNPGRQEHGGDPESAP